MPGLPEKQPEASGVEWNEWVSEWGAEQQKMCSCRAIVRSLASTLRWDRSHWDHSDCCVDSRLGGQRQKQGDQLGGYSQLRQGDGGLGQSVGGRSGDEWLDSGCILKVKWTWIDMRDVREREDSGKAPEFSADQGWSCRQPRWRPQWFGRLWEDKGFGFGDIKLEMAVRCCRVGTWIYVSGVQPSNLDWI